MNEQEIIIANKMIAEFMNYNPYMSDLKKYWCVKNHPDSMRWKFWFGRDEELPLPEFNNDWLMIMRVIGRIETLNMSVEITTEYFSIWGMPRNFHGKGIEIYSHPRNFRGKGFETYSQKNLYNLTWSERQNSSFHKMKTVYKSIVDFVSWFNVQKEKFNERTRNNCSK